jgi:hypothetical protein
MREEAKFTYEEWALFEKSKRMAPQDGEELIIAFYKKRFTVMFESDEPLPFELAQEYSYGEYLRIRCFRGN